MFYFFNNKEEVIGYIENQSCISAIQTEPLRGVISLEASFVGDNAKLLNNSTYIGHVDAVNDDEFQLYKITSLKFGESDGSGLSVTAVHVVFDELNNRDLFDKFEVVDVNMSAAFMEILKNSRWKLGRSYSNKKVSLSAENTNAGELITKLINELGIELSYRLDFRNNKIVGRYIDVYDTRGRDTYKRFAYGHNALDVVREINSKSQFTALIPLGKDIEDDNGEKHKLDISKISWSKENGDPIDKEKGSDTIELKQLTKLYGYSDGTPRKTFKKYDTEDPNELIQKAYDELVYIARPKVEFSAKIEDLGKLDLGDRVYIIRKDLDIYYMSRIYEIKRNLLSYGDTEVLLGDNLDLKNPNKSLNATIKDIDNKLGDIILDADKLKDDLGDTSILDDLRKQLEEGMFDHDSYNYFLRKGNHYGLPPGFYAFNKPVEQDPTSGIWMNGGKMAIANKRNSDGTLNWSTWLNGDGIIADFITTGVLQGTKVRWNLEDGTFLIGNDINDYSMYYDGNTLHFRNVDFDLSNSKDFIDFKNKTNSDLIKYQQDFQIANGKLESNILGIRRQVQDDISNSESRVKRYVIENFSTVSQTDEKITLGVSSLKKDMDDLEGLIKINSSAITQTSDSINLSINRIDRSLDGKVDTKRIISEINASEEGIKISGDKVNIDASKLDLKVDEVTTTWSRTSENPAINMKKSKITFYNENSNVAGDISTGKYANHNTNLIGWSHKPDIGTLSIGYYSSSYSGMPYITFDKSGLLYRHPISIHEDVDFNTVKVYGYPHFQNNLNTDGACIAEKGFATDGESHFNGATTFRGTTTFRGDFRTTSEARFDKGLIVKYSDLEIPNGKIKLGQSGEAFLIEHISYSDGDKAIRFRWSSSKYFEFRSSGTLHVYNGKMRTL